MVSRIDEKIEAIISDRFLFFPILSILVYYTFSIIFLIIVTIIFEEYLFFKILLSTVVVVQALIVVRFKKDNIYVYAKFGYRPLMRKSKLSITSNQISFEFHDYDNFIIEWAEFDSVEIKIGKRDKPLIVNLTKVYATELSVIFFETNRYGLLKMVKMLKLNSRRFRKNNLQRIAKILLQCAKHQNKVIIDTSTIP